MSPALSHALPLAMPAAASLLDADAIPPARHRREPAPTRVIEVGAQTAGIAVPERGGVRFFASSRTFAPLDGTMFRSVEAAAKAARDRARHRAREGAARR